MIPQHQVAQLPWSAAFIEDQRFRRFVSSTLAIALIYMIIATIITLPPRPKPVIKPANAVKLVIKRPVPKIREISEAEKRALEEEKLRRQRELEEERKRREEERKRLEEEERKKRDQDQKKRDEQKKLDEQRRKELEEQQRKKAEEQRLKDQERQKQLEAERARQKEEEARRQAEQAEQRRKEAERQRAEQERQRVAQEKQRGAEKAREAASALQDLFGDSRPSAATQGGALTKGKEAAAGVPAAGPSVIASTSNSLGKGSGGVDVKTLRNVGVSGSGATLGSRTEATVAATDFGVVSDGAGTGGAGSGGGGSKSRGRSVDLIIEQNKGRISSLYQRLFRRDPTQTGKVAVKITIKPSGEVENVEIVSSAIKDDDFLTKLKNLLKGLNFGPDETQSGPLSVTYPFDFIPEN